MFFFYQLIVSIIIILSPIIILFRVFKGKEDPKRFIEKFSFPTCKRNYGKLIWFHGASVGEIQSIIPLIEYYERKQNIKQILITTSTLSSSKILNKYRFKKTIHQFYPIDHFYFTENFIKYWKPSLAVFVESEIWPCMFKNLKNKKIPLILLNARLTKKSINRWIKLKKFTQSIFKNISITYPQNLETNSFIKKLKTTKIKLIGNLKFVENNAGNSDQINKKLKIQLLKKNIWVASSTHKSEEIFCAKAHIELKKRIKNLITIIIPRHIHRVNKIIPEIEKLNLRVTKHSSKEKSLKDIDIYIVDTFGETKKFHRISSSVFLGGSIINRGGQNPLEAARFGARILHGPNIDNFKDVYKLLNSLKISKKISSPKKMASLIIFNKNKKVGNKIKNIGAKILKKTIKELDKLIIHEYKKT